MRVAPPNPASRCACTLLRKASRAVARRYEAALSKAGLTATQMAILRALEREGPMVLSRLADELVLERTSLYRALRPLAVRKLVAIDALDKRSKQVTLTAPGRRKIAEALPHWRRVQGRLLADLGADEWPELAGRLDALLAVLGS